MLRVVALLEEDERAVRLGCVCVWRLVSVSLQQTLRHERESISPPA